MLTVDSFGRFLDTNKARMGVKWDTELCRAVGISPQQMHNYRMRPGSISVPVLARICNYLNVPLEERGKLLQ